jgi:hypothetical protein
LLNLLFVVFVGTFNSIYFYDVDDYDNDVVTDDDSDIAVVGGGAVNDDNNYQ